MKTQRPDAGRADDREPKPAADVGKSQAAKAGPQEQEAAGKGPASSGGGEKSGSDQGERIAQLEGELAGIKDRLMRALADQENLRRRAQRDREEAVRYANANFARDLLPIIDNLTRALDSLPEKDVADESVLLLLRGVSAIERQMLQALERHGIMRFDPLGETFDPHRHHAVFQNATSDQAPGTVTETLQPGYLHHDRLLRPAMVGVAGEGDTQAPPDDGHRRRPEPRHH